MGLWQIFNVLSLGANILNWCMYGTLLCVRQCSDPHYSDADPVLTFYFDTQTDPAFHFDADRDPYSTFHFDADPHPHPSFQKRLRKLKKCLNRFIFHSFWLLICKLMRIRIQLITLMRIHNTDVLKNTAGDKFTSILHVQIHNFKCRNSRIEKCLKCVNVSLLLLSTCELLTNIHVRNSSI